MKKILIVSIILGFLLCGCAGIIDDIKRGQILYNTPCYKGFDKINWADQAGFYESNYITLNRNKRAELLIQDMTNSNEDFIVITEYYKVEYIRIFYRDQYIWPIQDIKIEGEKIGQKRKIYAKR